MTKSYLKPLLAISGEPASANARSVLIRQLNREDFSHVIEEVLVSCVEQQSREDLAVAILELVVKQPSASATTQGASSKGLQTWNQYINVSWVLSTPNLLKLRIHRHFRMQM